MIIPNVKNRQLKNGIISFYKLVFIGNRYDEIFAEKYLRAYNIDNDIRVGNLNVVLTRNDKFSSGSYFLSVDDEIRIEYTDRDGLRNALATIILSLKQENKAFCLKKQIINDSPDLEFRSVLIDLARGLPDFDKLKEDVKRLSLAKCNYIHLHLMDSMGLCYYSDILRNDNGIKGTELYTKTQMKEFVSYCDALGIEVIPEFEIPAHANYLVETYPDLACKAEIENPSTAVVCAGSESTYLFFERLITEIIEIFPSKYIHMGGDELYVNDIPEWNWKPNWDNCNVCRQKMREEGINNTQGLYYYVVRRIYNIVKKYNKTLIMYNDEIDISKPVSIPKDTIIQFWRIAHRGRGPHKKCSFRKFLEQGFKLIVSPYEYTYIDLEEYANPEKVSWFDFKDYKKTGSLFSGVFGGEACAWDYGNPEYKHYEFSFTSAAILLLAKMWDSDQVVYNMEYRKSLTKLIIGPETPENYDIFQIFGSIMPPRINGRNSYICGDSSLLEEDEIENHKKVLNGLRDTYSPLYTSRLLKYIEHIFF